jgi:signal transduction histidine kinase
MPEDRLKRRWEAFRGSHDVLELEQPSSTLGAALVGLGFAAALVVVGYLPPVARASGLQQAELPIGFALAGATCALCAGRCQGTGTWGALCTLFGTAFYVSSVSVAAVRACSSFGVGLALAGGLMLVRVQARAYGLTWLFALAVCGPPAVCLLFWRPHPAVALILAAACVLALLQSHSSGERRKLAEQTTRLRTTIEVTQAAADQRFEAAMHASRAELNDLLHDLRNALSPIALNLMYLRSEHLLDGEGAAALEGAVEGQRKAEELVDQRLQRVRGELRGSPESFALEQVAERAAAAAGPHVRVALQSPMPEFCVIGSPDRMLAVLHHLINNASQAGARSVLLRMQRETDGNTLLLDVEDDGPGLSDDALARLFEPPLQSTHVDGPRIGLWLVHTYVALMGGTVSAESLPERGARFRLRLPGCNPLQSGVV